MLSKATLFKALFVLLPLVAFGALTSASDARRATLATATSAPEDAIENAIEGSYIVVLKAPEAPRDGELTQEEISRYVEDAAVDMAVRYRFEVELVYSHALTGFSIRAASETTVQRLMRDLRVERVEQNRYVFFDPIVPEAPPLPPSWVPPPWIPPGDILPVDPVEPPPGDINAADLPSVQYKAPWGLDRIDQRDLPLNGAYQYNTTAANVRVYVIDTGIRATHQEFDGRVVGGASFSSDNNGTDDCWAHGTHVAATIGGATYGVAKDVLLIPVRVDSDCTVRLSTAARVIAGVDWVTANRVLPAVANMSLAFKPAVPAIDSAVQNLIKSGVTVVAAAGNENVNACESSPARLTKVITVGASTKKDKRWVDSNFGACIDLFAPGSDILSAIHTSDSASASGSGTSMATPHVAGVAALWYGIYPFLQEPGVRLFVKEGATPNRLSDIGPGSPNRLLYTRWE